MAKEPTPKEATATANLRQAERQTIKLMQKRIKDISAQFLGEVDAILANTKWKAAPADLAKVEAQRLFIEKLAKEMDAALLKLEGVAADSGNAIASAQSEGLVQRWDKEYAKEYLARVHPKNGPSLTAVYTHSMAANAVATLRSVVVDTFATAAVAGMSARARAKLMQTAWAARCRDDDPCRFVDKAGRRWENARYVQMLVRTTAQRIETAAFCDSMTDDGFPLARISNDSDMDCEVCAAWEGRLIDLSHGNQLKKYGAVPLSAAREAGVFHPNCTHRLEYVSITEYPEEMVKEMGYRIGEKNAFGKQQTRKNAAVQTQKQFKKHVSQVEKAAEKRVGSLKPIIGASIKDSSMLEGLGLLPGDQIIPDEAEQLISFKEAEQRLKKGESVKDPLGREIKFADYAMVHLNKKGRKAVDYDMRMRSLDRAEATCENPHEIWYDPKGDREVYFRMMREEDGRRVCYLVTEDSQKAFSWHLNSKSFNHWRKGKLLYVRPKNGNGKDKPSH